MCGLDLRGRREALSLTPTALAAYLGVSYETYRNWESGRRAPSKAARYWLGAMLERAAHTRSVGGVLAIAESEGGPPDEQER